MYRLTIYGNPFGKEMPREAAERKLESSKWSIAGLGMRRVR